MVGDPRAFAEPGIADSSRAAVAVEETGFHSAIVASQLGMVDGATKTLERKPTGQTRIWTATTVWGSLAASPR